MTQPQADWGRTVVGDRRSELAFPTLWGSSRLPWPRVTHRPSGKASVCSLPPGREAHCDRGHLSNVLPAWGRALEGGTLTAAERPAFANGCFADRKAWDWQERT